MERLVDISLSLIVSGLEEIQKEFLFHRISPVWCIGKLSEKMLTRYINISFLDASLLYEPDRSLCHTVTY